MVVDWYKQHGYQFLALTEHNVIAEGEKWIDADTTDTRRTAVAKYVKRFGDRWPEFRTTNNKRQVRLKPLTSSKAHPNPWARGDVEVAWTQPVVP